MCVIAAKYFPDVGWALAKNRDRNYRANIELVKSRRRGVERLYLRDMDTYYTEGVNEFGVSIVSASLQVDADEKEIDKMSKIADDDSYMSPDGKKLRTALFEQTAKDAVDSLIESKITGFTLVADTSKCFLIESSFEEAGRSGSYKYVITEILPGEYVVRTNHGINLKWSGYQAPDKDSIDPEQAQRNLDSSVSRLEIAQKNVATCMRIEDFLDCMAERGSDDNFMNPVRLGTPMKEMVTTGQILIVPNERTLHYKPIFSRLTIVYDKLNHKDSKTYFEVVSNRKLLTFVEASQLESDIPTFTEFAEIQLSKSHKR